MEKIISISRNEACWQNVSSKLKTTQHMKYLTIIISIILFLAIESKMKTELISFNAQSPSSKKEYLEYELKLKGNFNIIYKKDTVVAEFYRLVNKCKTTSGKIVVKNQTIKLSVVETGEGCKELNVKKVKFIIRNPENKKFQFLRD
jgi:hypothetical protein